MLIRRHLLRSIQSRSSRIQFHPQLVHTSLRTVLQLFLGICALGHGLDSSGDLIERRERSVYWTLGAVC